MKKILVTNTSVLLNDKILNNKNILVENNKLKIQNFSEKEDNLLVINGEGKLVLPSFLLFKNTIFDVLPYKYLNEFKSEFELDKDVFKNLPFDIVEKTLNVISKRIALNGHSILFYSHLSYQMVKNSLLTISKKLEKEYFIRTSLSYFNNDKLPEQIILSKKENQDFKTYSSNIDSNFKSHHTSYYFPNNFEEIELDKINHFYFGIGTEKDYYEKYVRMIPDDSLGFIQFEDDKLTLDFEPSFNTYLLINEDRFNNQEFSKAFMKKIEKNPELNFFIVCGYNVYNVFNAFFHIFKLTKDINIIKVLKNQIINLQKIPEFLFKDKIGKIDNNYTADFSIIDLLGFPVEDFDQFIDFILLYYLERPYPSTIIQDGKIIYNK